MKRHIITFNLVLCLSLTAFSQSILRDDAFHFSASVIAYPQSDTVYYDKGGIKYITFYPNSVNIIRNRVVRSFELVKKVFQYDQCGNLRNITEISRYTGQITSCLDYYFNHPYQLKHSFTTNVNCTEPWTKPLLLFFAE